MLLQHDASLVFRRSTRYPLAPDIAFQLKETDVGVVAVTTTPVGAGPAVPDKVGVPIGVLTCEAAAHGIAITATTIAIRGSNVVQRMRVSPLIGIQYATVKLFPVLVVEPPVR